MIFLYDGSFDGLLSALFEAFKPRGRDASILPESRFVNLSLFEPECIAADPEKAGRVTAGMKRLSPDLAAGIYKAYLSHAEGVEDLILAVLRVGFREGRDPIPLRQFDCVVALSSIIRKVGWEAQRFLQFVRFVKLKENLYAADIEPEYEVLPLIGNHFHRRFPASNFIIRDLSHRQAVLSTPRGWSIAPLPEENPPLPEDGMYESMWQKYFKIIAIENRVNPKLQQKFVPLKYRKHLTEFRETGLARPE